MRAVINTISYDIINFTLLREVNKINTFKMQLIDDAIQVDEFVDIFDTTNTLVFSGMITERKKSSNGIFDYTISQSSYILKKYRVSNNGDYNVNISSPTSVNNILDNYILPTGWTRSSSDTTTLAGLKFYFSNTLSAIYKVLNNNRGHNVWFDDVNKTVGFGSNWHDLRSIKIEGSEHGVYSVDAYDGLKVKFTSTGTLPSPLVAGTEYELELVSNGKYKIKTSPTQYVTLTTNGSGNIEIATVEGLVNDNIGVVSAEDSIVLNRINYIEKIGTENSARSGVDQIIVIGATSSISGSYPKTGIPIQPRLIVFQYEELGSNGEADLLAEKLFNDYGDAKSRIKIRLPPSFNYNETDLVNVDGVDYTVFDVSVEYGGTTLGLSSGRETIYDILGDALKEVTGDISSAMAMTYDGGLQNIGAPYVNEIIEADIGNNKFLVDNNYEQFPNGATVALTTTGVLPAPLTTELNYHVVSATVGNLKLSMTKGGGVINITNAGSGTHRISRIGIGYSSTFTANPSNEILTLGTPNKSMYANNDRIIFTSTGAMPGGVNANHDYYVIGSTTSSFQITQSPGGITMVISSNGSGVIRCRNMGSMSVPAMYNLEVSNINNIDNYEIKCDFDYYKEGISVGEDVEFLSKPVAINNNGQASFVNMREKVGIEVNCSPIISGFQDGLLTVRGVCIHGYSHPEHNGNEYEMKIYCIVKYPDGSTWTSPTTRSFIKNPSNSAYGGSSGMEQIVGSHLPFSSTMLIQGSNMKEVSGGDVKVTVYLEITSYYKEDILMKCDILVQRTPRHKHVIDRSFNVTGSIYPRNVYAKITNSDLIDEFLVISEQGTFYSIDTYRNLYISSDNPIFTTGDMVMLDNAPSPCDSNTIYYVVEDGSNFLRISEKLGGDNIYFAEDLTDIIVKKIGYGGIVSGTKTINIQDKLRTGKNKITMFSDYPGSVYVTGKYDNYGI